MHGAGCRPPSHSSTPPRPSPQRKAQHTDTAAGRRVGLIPLLSRSKPHLTCQPPRPLSAAKRCLAQLDLDSDTDSDPPPPSPRCRRRRLFPVSFGHSCGAPRAVTCPGRPSDL